MLQSNRLAIYAIGKIKKLWIRDGINQYKKRMPELVINELKTFNLNNLRSNNNIIICLSEEGKQFNSVELCSLLLNFKNKKINFLIGDTDGVSLDIKEKLNSIFSIAIFKDISKNLMKQRMIKSDEEISIIKNGARIADLGAEEIVKHIKPGQSELEIAIAGRDKMEREIAKSYPDAEYMDTWVWFQSGINTDGAHNPKTNRALQNGDILSLNTFPMISGYYTALERTLFVNEVDDASLKAWEANVKVHKRGLELIKPGAKCSEICEELNNLFAELGYLQYRTFGYGHSFGMLSHFYGREAGLELREDIDTVLEKNMVISMEPMIMIPEEKPGAGGYREHDILVIKEDGAENITKFPFGPDHNIIKN